MTHRAIELSPSVLARTAGALYLLIIVCGITAEAVIRSGLIVSADAAATAENILSSPPRFRLGFFLDSVMLLADAALAVIFYLLFRPVSKPLALGAAVFRLMQTAVISISLLAYYAVMLLLGGELYPEAFASEQLQAGAMLFLDLHAHGYDLGLIFFGVSNLLLGTLVIRSGFLPALLGYGLLAAAVVYLGGSYTRFLLPRYAPLTEPFYLIPLAAELAFGLWLLFKGVRSSPVSGS